MVMISVIGNKRLVCGLLMMGHWWWIIRWVAGGRDAGSRGAAGRSAGGGNAGGIALAIWS